MTYVTIEADIADGQIIPKAGTTLPAHGRALVTLLPEASPGPNWEMVESALGVLHRPNLDSTTWQRQVRSEWDWE